MIDFGVEELFDVLDFGNLFFPEVGEEMRVGQVDGANGEVFGFKECHVTFREDDEVDGFHVVAMVVTFSANLSIRRRR